MGIAHDDHARRTVGPLPPPERGRSTEYVARPNIVAPSMTMLAVTNVVAGYGAHDEVLKGVGITAA